MKHSPFACRKFALGPASLLLALAFNAHALAQSADFSSQPAIIQSAGLVQPVQAKSAMAVSQHYLATEVGRDILKRGGNAVDAAVAMGFALAVVLPRAGNISGGGFMMVHLAEENRTLAIDYREMAPKAAHRNMFLGSDGKPDAMISRFSHRAAGVPGTVAGLHHAWKNYGSMPWKSLLAPAIRLAKKGFAVSHSMHRSLGRARHMQRNAEAQRLFYDANGEPLAAGAKLVQPQLAKTLQLIARSGPDGFYKGSVADAIVAEMRRNKGLITHEDLANYRVVERQPVEGTYRGLRIRSMPPPSSGGVHLIQMLNVLEGYDLASMGKSSADSLHLLTETMKPAFADRAKHLGDPDFHAVPLRHLLSKDYAAEMRESISQKRARASDKITASRVLPAESPETTHFSVVDAAGNAVANTYTLNFSYGSGIMVPGAGILLNNEMDDFSAQPGVANAYGLIGGEANAVEAGKRPLSSMTPTMVFDSAGLRLVTGSPGGSLIITTVLLHLVDVFDFGLNIAEAMHTPKIHHQWLPEVLFYERGLSPDTLKELEKRGHTLRASGYRGSLESIAIQADGTRLGAADPRQPDGNAAGY